MSGSTAQKVAIVGLSGLFPGCEDLDDFVSANLKAQSRMSETRQKAWDLSPQKNIRARGLDSLPHDYGYFITTNLLLDPTELIRRLTSNLLTQVNHKTVLSKTGLICGQLVLPTPRSAKLYKEWLKGEETHYFADGFGVAAETFATIAKELQFGLGGISIDAACASSLYAVSLCVDALIEGRADLMIAGGMAMPDPLFTQMGFNQLGALSKSGNSRPFDSAADGLLVGQGAGLFALKRLEDAIRDQDNVMATVLGCGLSSDLNGSLLAPSSEGQVRAMEAAYKKAPDLIGSRSIDYFECHATGTPLGDAVEVESLRLLDEKLQIASKDCCIGSVKGTVGHMLTAAGAAGLARVLLCMQKGIKPPTAGFEKAHQQMGIEKTSFNIPQTATKWQNPLDRPRRAAISGFGFGGINGHLVIEEFNQQAVDKPPRMDKFLAPSVADSVVICGVHAIIGDDRNKLKAFPRVRIKKGKYKIPPDTINKLLPQQLWALENCTGALSDARLGIIERPHAGVFLGINLDPGANQYSARWEILGKSKVPPPELPQLTADRVLGSLGGIVGSRVARELKFGGCGYTLSSDEQSGLSALEKGFQDVRSGRLELAVVSAIDQTSHPLTAGYYHHEQTQSYTDAAIAIVIAKESDARKWGCPIYAKIQSISAKASQYLEPRKAHFGAATTLLEFVKHLSEPAQGNHFMAAGHRLDYEINYTKLDLPLTSSYSPPSENYSEVASPHTRPSPYQALGLVDFLKQTAEPKGDSAKKSHLPDFSTLALSKLENQWHREFILGQKARGEAHGQFLSFISSSQEIMSGLDQNISYSGQKTRHFISSTAAAERSEATSQEKPPKALTPKGRAPFNSAKPLLDYDACEIFANGQIGDVLGAEFKEIDSYPTRVRLPEGPLLLCHRIMSVEGTPKSMGTGRLITEHDVHADAWYLDNNRIPACISIESGQADLFLSAYLGVDFLTKGQRVYRLLDAAVTFHDELPKPGSVIVYDIKITGFFFQSQTPFFRFNFEAKVDGKKLMTMEDGCAGFFSQGELDSGRGVVKPPLLLQPVPGKITGDFSYPLPMPRTSYSERQLDALRLGDLAHCFGEPFDKLELSKPLTLPSDMLRLVHRITDLDPVGGRYGIGKVIGEADINPDDWFITCHFMDDMVMPGTLMYECCLHTLRVFLLRAGWVGNEEEFRVEPKIGVASKLKCRGQVLDSAKVVRYEIEIKEIGYGPDAYVIADALMFADDKAIVDITDMSLCHPGLTKQKVEKTWGISSPAFTKQQLLEFADGQPSRCFGEHYEVFDSGEKRCARLPRPPFLLMDSVTKVDGPLGCLQAGTKATSSFIFIRDSWYQNANGDAKGMPFSILLEVALQPCGFLAAYMGSALTSEEELFFRNLGGSASLKGVALPGDRLTIRTEVTGISRSAGMIIQNFKFQVIGRGSTLFAGDTVFGFFTGAALARQVGIGEELEPTPEEKPQFSGPYPAAGCLPEAPLLMVDSIAGYWENGGINHQGYARATKKTNSSEWFFESHFKGDPVMPGSLGIEAMVQLAKFIAWRKNPKITGLSLATSGVQQTWVYRGQVIPTSQNITLEVEIKSAQPERQELTFQGRLAVDGLVIYKIDNFGLSYEYV